MRKIIQISAIPETEDAYETIYALCDDGTLWFGELNKSKIEWTKVDGIPDDTDAT